jgi:YD repeat-containing protein
MPGDTTTYETRFTYTGGRMASRAVVRRDLLPGKLATTTYAYANNARLTSVTIPYDTVSSGRTAVTTFAPWDEKGLTVLTLVDTAGLPTRVDGPIAGTGDAADFWIDPLLGGPKRIVGLGLNDTTRITRGVSDNPGLITQVQYPNRRTVTMTWNTRANLVTVRDSTRKCGVAPCDSLPTKVTTYTYGDTGTPDSPTRVQDALGRHSDFTYDALGLTSLATDTRNHRTRFYNRTGATDTLRGLVDSIAELNVMTWIESTAVEVLDTLTTRFYYDSATGNLLQLKSPLGVITSYQLDAAGNVTEVVDPMRNRTVFGTIDAWNRVGEVDHAATKSTTFPSYNPLAECDSTQILCTDSLVAGAATQVERYFLSPVGIDSTSDARGVKRRFRADARGAVWRESDEFNNSRRAFYNAFGAVDSTVSRTGVTVRYTYDALGRLLKRSWPYVPNFGNSADSVPSDSIRYVYDVMGNILADSGREGVITRTYYGDNSVRTRRTSVGGLDSLYYFYDATGARTRVIRYSAKSGARDSIKYAYNSAGDLQTLTVYFGPPNAATRSFSFLWDSLGRRREVIYPNNDTVRFVYDGGGTLRRVFGLGAGRFDFTLRNTSVDPAGNIRIQQASCNPITGDDIPQGSLCQGGTGLTTTSTFNRLGELVRQSQTGAVSRTDSMTFDASGNMTYRKTTGSLAEERRWTMQAGSNRLAQETTRNVTFNFDNNGARQSAVISGTFDEKYWYDGLGRTSGIAETGPTAHLKANSCRYDPDGQMYRPCDEQAPYLAFDGANVVTTLTDEWRFVTGPGVDDPLVGLYRTGPNAPRLLYFITDGAGRQLMVTDSAGLLTSLDVPGPGSPRGHWRYAGATSSANTFEADRLNPAPLPSVSLFRSRAYDQKSGRWTQEDPIGFSGGLNLYRYNGNNPVAYTDPFGLCPIPPSSCFQKLADWGARRGGVLGTVALNAGAAGAAAYEVLGGGDAENAVGAAREGRFGAALASAFFALPGGRAIRGGKAAVRAGIEALEVSDDVVRGIRRSLRSGGGAEWGVQKLDDGGALVHRFVPGNNNVSSTVYTYRVNPDGTVTAGKQAYDAAGYIEGTTKTY